MGTRIAGWLSWRTPTAASTMIVSLSTSCCLSTGIAGAVLDPEAWLRTSAARLCQGDCLDQLAGADELNRRLSLEIQRAAEPLRQAACLPAIPRPYQDLAVDELNQARQVQETRGLLEQAVALSGMTFGRLPTGSKKLAAGSPPGTVFDPGRMERFKILRNQAKKDLQRLGARYAPLTRPEVLAEQHQTGHWMESLVQLVLDLEQRLAQAKLSRGWIDYSDMEHLTLTLLSDETLCAELAAGFDEVLIDEYQDINPVQEAIFARLRQGENFFAVGDVKQSIYRFRLADPQLFLSKYLAYGQGQGGRRIDLNRNFRSQVQVIRGVNQLFRQLMVEEVAELAYDQAAVLRPGREEEGAPPEFVLVQQAAPDVPPEEAPTPEEASTPEEEGEGTAPPDSAVRTEARYIAQRIQALRQAGYAYGEMAILLRSLKSSRDLILGELMAAGIPVIAEGSGGYLDSPELEMALAFLRVIDNPRQNPALAGVLRCPLVGFQDEELLALGLEYPEGDLYDALLHAAEQPGEDPLIQRVRAFLDHLAEWRSLGGELRPSALLLRLYDQAGFYHLCGALPGGETRQGYLRLLYQQACAYEAQGYAGLYRFICQVEDCRTWGKGDGSPPGPGGGDRVRLMSIHKSKGLEFPVVFVAGLNTQFNFRDEYGDVIWNRDLGLGARYGDRAARRKIDTPAHLAIAGRMHDQALAEEMRVYYVALTRARERLILTACLPQVGRAVASWAAVADWSEEALPTYVLARARRPLDWFGPALLRHPDSGVLRQLAGVEDAGFAWDRSRWLVQVVSAPPPVGTPVVQTTPDAESLDPALEQQVEAALSYRYPDRDRCAFPAKWSVSALNRQTRWEEPAPILTPEALADIQGESEPAGSLLRQGRNAHWKATDRGTAYHRVLELADLRRISREELQDQIHTFVAQGLLAQAAADLVDPARLAQFFATPVGRRLCGAAQVRRETAFTMLKEIQGVEVVVQGMLDAAFQEADGWVLLDYKTGGWGKSDEELLSLYGEQLACYKQAMERLWQVPVKEAYLCMLDGGRAVRL